MTEQYIRYAAMFIIIMMAVIDDYRRFKVSNRIIIAGMVIGVVINMGRKMQKHDKMVALAKEKSAEMTETAITAIETMYRKNIKISVAELTKLTGLSRGFFYNNPNVKQVMMELKEKQQGMILRNPKSDAIAKAQEARIKSLEQKLSDSVPKNEYESLQKKYEELQVKYSQMKKGTLLKMYDQL